MSNAGPSAARGRFDERQQHVDADAHVRRQHDRDALARTRRARPCCAAESPVVPTTAAVPCRAQAARWASVPSGRVKSISTSAARNAASTSAADASRRSIARSARRRRGRCAGLRGMSSARGERQVGGSERRLDQRLPHPAAGAGDRDPDVAASLSRSVSSESVEHTIPDALAARRFVAAAALATARRG